MSNPVTLPGSLQMTFQMVSSAKSWHLIHPDQGAAGKSRLQVMGCLVAVFFIVAVSCELTGHLVLT